MKDYRVIDLLGRGNMGSVHRAVHVRLGREVALKLVSPLPDSDRDARFQREIQVLLKLDHPNVVQFLDGGEHEGQLWYAMELVEGPTLAGRLRDGPLPLGEVLPILHQILEALIYLHGRGVIHRDVTSNNILLAPNGRVVLSDFGLARSGKRLTEPGMAVGTPIYMAPEALKGDSTPASDLFSAGVVAYELLTGKNPFLSKTVEATVTKIFTESLPPVPGVDPRAMEVILRLLERDPARRWRTARDAQVAVAGLSEPRAKAPPSPAGDKTVVLAAPPPRRRAPVAAALALAVVAGLVALRRDPPPPPRPSVTAVATPAPARPLVLSGVRVVPLVHAVRVIARNPERARLVIELGRGQPPAWREAAHSEEPNLAHEIAALTPDTVYGLRVRAENRTGGLPAYTFRTLKKGAERAADDLFATLQQPDEVAASPLFGDLLATAPADTRFRQPLFDLLSSSAQLSDDQVLAIAGYAVQCPDRRLASRLVERLPAVKWTQARARVVHAAVAADLPGAAELVLANLKPWSADDLLSGLPALGHVIPAAQLAQVLKGQEGAPGHARMLALAPERDRLEQAAALFEVGSPRDAALFAELGDVLPRGERGDAVLERAAPARRLAALVEAPRAIACRLVPEPAPDAGVAAWAERLRAGCAEARKPLERAILAGTGPDAARAVPLLASAASEEFLVAACKRDDLADAAAWAIAQAGLRSALPALAAARDPRGVALWARARLRDRSAAAGVIAALADPHPVDADAKVRLALAAWAAGELALTEASAPLSTLAGDREAPPFARACARASLNWLAGAPPPRTYLLLPDQAALDTDLSLGQLESYAVWAEAAQGAAGATVAWCGVPLWAAAVGTTPVRHLVQLAGTLRIQRAERPSTAPGALLRVSIEPSRDKL